MSERPDIPSRPTVYKGTKMRSRLEADYAAHMDRNGEAWEYEPTCFASDDGQWLPDFRVGKNRVLVEVKSAHLLERDEDEDSITFSDRIDVILKRMTIAWQSEPNAPLQLVFWSYGAVGAELAIIGHQSIPWMTFGSGLLNFPMAWLGMGQDAILMGPPPAKDSAA